MGGSEYCRKHEYLGNNQLRHGSARAAKKKQSAHTSGSTLDAVEKQEDLLLTSYETHILGKPLPIQTKKLIKSGQLEHLDGFFYESQIAEELLPGNNIQEVAQAVGCQSRNGFPLDGRRYPKVKSAVKRVAESLFKSHSELSMFSVISPVLMMAYKKKRSEHHHRRIHDDTYFPLPAYLSALVFLNTTEDGSGGGQVLVRFIPSEI